jgi:G-utrophin, putative (fragment)
MTELMNSLTEFNEVRYAAYRTALKLQSVQKRLCLHFIPINNIIAIFDEHGLRALNEKEINVPDMISCLQSIYESAAAEYPTFIDVPLCIDLCLNWLLNLYAG